MPDKNGFQKDIDTYICSLLNKLKIRNKYKILKYIRNNPDNLSKQIKKHFNYPENRPITVMDFPEYFKELDNEI